MRAKYLKGQSGITLVALVITVVILLILAGVSMSLITGDGGLFGRAQGAAGKYDQAAANEYTLLNNFMQYLEGTPNKPNVKILQSALGKQTEEGKTDDYKVQYLTWTYDETHEVWNEVASNNEPQDWYNYAEGRWANIKVTNNGIETYWVWIPRFAYAIGSGSESTPMDVVFVPGRGKTGPNGEEYYYATDLEITAGTSNNATYGTGRCVNLQNDATGKYIVHPAFTFTNSEDLSAAAENEQLEGIWMAKFEASNDGNDKVQVKGSTTIFSGDTKSETVIRPYDFVNLKDAFTKTQAMTANGNALEKLTASTLSIDTHPAKNSEWGAVAILSQSKYGIFTAQSINRETGRIWNNSIGVARRGKKSWSCVIKWS